jgi:hypothetical protein
MPTQPVVAGLANQLIALDQLCGNHHSGQV